MMTDDKKDFTRPNKSKRQGIRAVHVDAAMEMVKLHTSGRFPPSKRSECHPRQLPSVSKHQPTEPLAFSKHSAESTHPNVSIPSNLHEGDCHNPQCEHCGQVIIPSPQSTFPLQDRPSISVNHWNIFTIKTPILSTQEIDDLNDTRFEFPLPEMIFGNNKVKIISEKSNQVIEFNALDALESMDEQSNLKVSYHKEWLNARKTSSLTDVSSNETSNKVLTRMTDQDSLKPYDWTYSSNYKGSTNTKFEETTEEIPIDRLKKPDPILFFDESVLYEDELGDNGISMLSTKIRVMPSCLLLLCRFFLRIDNVIFRIRDTRLFIDFESDTILREYKVQESPYKALLSRTKGASDPKSLFRDSNWVSLNIPIIMREVEKGIVPDP